MKVFYIYFFRSVTLKKKKKVRNKQPIIPLATLRCISGFSGYFCGGVVKGYSPGIVQTFHWTINKKKAKHNRINWKAHLCAQMSAHCWAWDLYSDKVLLFLFVGKRVLLKNKWLIKQCEETREDHFIVKNWKFKEHHVRTIIAVSDGSSHRTIWGAISGAGNHLMGVKYPVQADTLNSSVDGIKQIQQQPTFKFSNPQPFIINIGHSCWQKDKWITGLGNQLSSGLWEGWNTEMAVTSLSCVDTWKLIRTGMTDGFGAAQGVQISLGTGSSAPPPFRAPSHRFIFACFQCWAASEQGLSLSMCCPGTNNCFQASKKKEKDRKIIQLRQSSLGRCSQDSFQ